MRPIATLPLALLLACGPLAPPDEAASTTRSTTTETTDAPASTTTITPGETTATPTTTTAPTSPVDTTTSSDSDGIPDLPIAGIQCDVFQQDCKPGQKCVAWADDGGSTWNATRCVNVTGDQAPGEPCTAPEGPTGGIDDCAHGAFCWEVDEENHGTCFAQCTGDWLTPECPQDFTCLLHSEAVLVLCRPTCDPLLQDCADADKLCIPNKDDFYCEMDGSGAEGQANEPCEFNNSCDKGLACLNIGAASAACPQGSAGCCQPFCKYPDSPCPNPDQKCVQWYDPMMPIPPEYASVGVCAVPQ